MEWIKCSERMPDDLQYVAVIDGGHGVFMEALLSDLLMEDLI